MEKTNSSLLKRNIILMITIFTVVFIPWCQNGVDANILADEIDKINVTINSKNSRSFPMLYEIKIENNCEYTLRDVHIGVLEKVIGENNNVEYIPMDIESSIDNSSNRVLKKGENNQYIFGISYKLDEEHMSDSIYIKIVFQGYISNVREENKFEIEENMGFIAN